MFDLLLIHLKRKSVTLYLLKAYEEVLVNGVHLIIVKPLFKYFVELFKMFFLNYYTYESKRFYLSQFFIFKISCKILILKFSYNFLKSSKRIIKSNIIFFKILN